MNNDIPTPTPKRGNRKTDPLTTADLNYFTGDLERFRHQLNRKVIYTPGVQFMAEKGEAYWLIDAIASWIGSQAFKEALVNDPRIGHMHFWTLKRFEGNQATLFAKADSPDLPFISQDLEFTDFPLCEISIWAAFDGDYWTLYLPSEH